MKPRWWSTLLLPLQLLLSIVLAQGQVTTCGNTFTGTCLMDTPGTPVEVDATVPCTDCDAVDCCVAQTCASFVADDGSGNTLCTTEPLEATPACDAFTCTETECCERETNSCLDLTSSNHRCQLFGTLLVFSGCGLVDDDLWDMATCFDEVGIDQIEELWLDDNQLQTLPDGVFDSLVALLDLELYDNQLQTLPDGLFDNLVFLQNLELHNNDLQSLPDGLFDNLVALQDLHLENNQLQTLPDGLFDNLVFLQSLWLDNNQLQTLPDELFDNLVFLQNLDLENNLLQTLPDGLFDNLVHLRSLELQYNELQTLPGGLFDNFVVLQDLNLLGNRDLECFPRLPPNYDGTWSVDGGVPACGETNSCLDMMSSDYRCQLSGTTLDFSGCDLLDDDLGDLATCFNKDGIDQIETLGLHDNQLQTLPNGLFDNLVALQRLTLYNNQLQSLPDGLFDNLVALVVLFLTNNQLQTLPDGLFGNLVALEQLWLHFNKLQTLPDGLFDNLVALGYLELQYNDLQTLPDGLFDNLVALQDLDLFGNRDLECFPRLPPDFDGTWSVDGGVPECATCGTFTGTCLTDTPGTPVEVDATVPCTDCDAVDCCVAQTCASFVHDGSGNTLCTTEPLEATPACDAVTCTETECCERQTNSCLDLTSSNYRCQLPGSTTTLDFSACGLVDDDLGDLATCFAEDGIIQTQRLRLENNQLQKLPDGLFDNLLALQRLTLTNNQLQTLQDGLFDNLVALQFLVLISNRLQTLPDGLFDNLLALQLLVLQDNDLQTLPDGLFDNLVALKILELYDNDLQTLPDGLFDNLVALQTLDLVGNPDLECFPSLPPDFDGTWTVDGGVPECAPACPTSSDFMVSDAELGTIRTCLADGTAFPIRIEYTGGTIDFDVPATLTLPDGSEVTIAGFPAVEFDAFLVPGTTSTLSLVGGFGATCTILLTVDPTCDCGHSIANCPDDLYCCKSRNVCDVFDGGDPSDPSACGDPHMTGFLGQKFDFTGEDGAYYALIADDDMHINMRVTSPVTDLPEITYITGLSVLTYDTDGFDHSIVIEVKDPHNSDSSCPAGVSPCLADGSLRVVLDGEETLLGPGTVSLGQGLEVSAANLPGACRSFGFEKYWERKKLKNSRQDRRLNEPVSMGEWILGDPTATNMNECVEYVARAEVEEGGVFAHQSEHASFQIVTPKGTVRLSHGRLHQIAMRDPTDQYDLPDHLTWQMNMAVDHNEVSRDAKGILGETFVPTRDADGRPIMTGMEAIRGQQEDYRVEGAMGMDFGQDAYTS